MAKKPSKSSLDKKFIFISFFLLFAIGLTTFLLNKQQEIRVYAAITDDFPLGVFEQSGLIGPDSFGVLIDDAKAHNLNAAMIVNGFVSSSNSLLSVSDAKGFNTYIGPQGDLERQWFHPTDFGNPEVTVDIATARSIIYPMVDQLSSHPSLKGYYLIDEPSLDLETKVALAVQAFQERDTNRPAFPVLIGKDRVGPIFDAAQPRTMVIDVYPYGWNNVACSTMMSGFGYSSTDMVDYIRQITTTKPITTPLLIILQAHQYGDGNSGFSLRQPSPVEARLENWIAIGEGAKGIFWFIYQSYPDGGIVGFRDNPALFTEIGNLAKRVSSIKASLLNSNKIADEFTVSGSSNSYVSTLSDGIKKYAVVANRSCSPSTISVSSSSTGVLVDIETNTTYQLNTPISFAPGDGKVFELTQSTPTIISTPTSTPTLIPTPILTPIGANGLIGAYFNNRYLSGSSTLTRVDPNIAFNWGKSSPGPSIPIDNFSVRWTGYVVPRYSQTYTFYAKTDDGTKVWVNNVLIINNWKCQAPTEKYGRISLKAGVKYSLKMEYLECSQGTQAYFRWSSPSQVKEIIPQSQLFTQ